jgi:retinol dehydrogenase 12
MPPPERAHDPTPDARGPPWVVTGATSGIGLETALALGRRGLPLVLVGRDPARLASTVEAVRATRATLAEGRLADLTRCREVRRLARAVRSDHPRLGGLINDAGALFMRRQESAEGVEKTWALNVLAPFLLTQELLPALRAAPPARIVNVASAAHASGHLRLEDLEGRRRYGGWSAYAQSKLALILLTQEFARREPADRVSFYSCHPGFVRTRYGQNNPGVIGPAIRLLAAIAGISAERGAAVVVRLALDPTVAGESGGYFVRDRRASLAAKATDPDAASAIWSALERRTAEFDGTGPAGGGPTVHMP